MLNIEGMSYEINEIHKNFLIVGGTQEFDKGLLFPHNIVYDGEDMSLPFAQNIMNQLRKDSKLLSNVQVLSRFGVNNEYAILYFDCKDIIHIPEYKSSLKENIIYQGKIIAKTQNSTIIATNGCFGYIDDPIDKEIDDVINVVITQNARNKFGFCRLSVVQ